MDMTQHFHESNLIEGYDNKKFDEALALAWEYLIEQDKLSHNVICKVQKIAVKHQADLKQSWRGHYRKIGVRVGRIICPNAEEINELMTNWICDVEKTFALEKEILPIYKAFCERNMHIRFEKIHPFVDGNGRTGRLLMWWHELKLGLKPTLILNSEKLKYYEWFL